MVQDIALSLDQTPHQLLVAPTGFGKSLTYMGIAALTGWRVGVLTATKSLQDQLTREFSQIGMIDVKGQSNYTCNASLDSTSELRMFFRRGHAYTARTAPCRRGVRCPLKEGGCGYYDRIRQAARADLFVTNYDFWMHNRHQLGKVDLLVMDEAHQAPDELADHLSFRLTPDHRRLLHATFPGGDGVGEWLEWAAWAVDRVDGLRDGEGHGGDLGDLGLTLRRMGDALGRGEWVIEHHGTGGATEVTFDCIDPESFGREVIWGGINRVLLVSATVNVMTAKALGMDAAKVKVWEAKSSFPKARRPVYVVQGAPRLNFRSLEGEKRMWVALADRIIGARADRKGIAHTTSFDRAKYLFQHSRQQGLMRMNESRNTAHTVAQFKQTRGGGLLVSPSMTTGWDFPLSECEYQLIGKIPFPDLRSKAAKARNQRNKEWAGYTAAQVIVQASGRGMRSADDQCETFIIDGNFGWWYDQNRRFLPQWWVDALVWVDLAHIPPPPPKLPAHV